MPRILRSASTGIGSALASLAGGQHAYRQGYDEALGVESKLARELAAIRASDAQARLHEAQAGTAAAEGDILRGRGAMAGEVMASAAGVDVPTLSAFRQKLRTGEAPQVPMGPPAEDGRMGVGRAQFDDATASRIGQALMRLAPVLGAAKDIKPDDYAKALDTYRTNDLGDQVLAGQRKPGEVGAAQAAAAGKPLYNADSTGAVLDLFGGGLDVSNPMAQGTIGLRGAQAGQAKAAAAENYAQAGAANASAARTRQAMRLDAAEAAGAGPGSGKAPAGYRWTTAGALEPIPGGPADPAGKAAKGAKPPAEVQRMNIALRSLDEGLAAYEQLLSEFNPRNPAQQAAPVHRARAESLVADLRMQLKEAQALGALTGPDLQILDAALASPTSLRGAFYGRDGLGAQLKEVRAGLTRRRRALADEYGPPAAAPAGPAPAAPRAAPAPGTVEQGWRFKGGNPADPNSWERAR